MDKIIRIGMDTSKHVFQLHGVNAAEQLVLRRKLTAQRDDGVLREAGADGDRDRGLRGAHYWARELRALGHEVRLIPPQYVKPYVKRGKNDAADAEAICEAMSRPTMRFVPVKTAEQQAALMLAGLRERLVRQRTQLANAIRGYAAEFGLVAAKGLAQDRAAAVAHARPTRPCRRWRASCLPRMAARIRAARGAARRGRGQLMAWHRANEPQPAPGPDSRRRARRSPRCW